MIHELTDNILAVEVPEIKKNDHWEVINNNMLVSWTNYIKLPPGSYRLMFLSKECTEEDCKEVVEHYPYKDMWLDYNYTGADGCKEWYTNPTDSFASLLKSKNLNTDKNYCIIEKIKL